MARMSRRAMAYMDIRVNPFLIKIEPPDRRSTFNQIAVRCIQGISPNFNRALSQPGFGGATREQRPLPDPEPDRDDLYPITSAYRPPEAVVRLARKEFKRPVEILSSKRFCNYWQPGEAVTPRFHETLYIGETFQMGSVVSAEPEKAWNPSVFNFMAYNSKRGVDYFAANTTPIWEHSEKLKGDQLAQYRNLLVWLRPAAPAQTFYFQLPRTARIQKRGDTWFVGLEKTCLALRFLNLAAPQEVQPEGKRGDRKPRYTEELFFKAATSGNGHAGFALEAADGKTLAEFEQAVRSKASVDTVRLGDGVVSVTGIDGARLEVSHNRENDLPNVRRNGTVHDWSSHRELHRPTSGRAPISLGWQKGALRVEAGGKVFQTMVTLEGKVSGGK